MKRVLAVFLFVSAVFFAASQVSAAEDPIKVYVDGRLVNFAVDPVQENGTTLVQFRPIFQKLGMLIYWVPETQTIKSGKIGLELVMTVGSNKAYINGVETILTVPSKTINNNTFVPLRFIGEASGLPVIWDEKTRSIFIGEKTINNELHFRNTYWGASAMDVKGSETAELVEEDGGALLYRGQVLDIDTSMLYLFTQDGRLNRAYFRTLPLHSNDALYLEDYENLKRALTQKYGTPILDEEIWHDDLYMGGSRSDLAMAVSKGDLAFVAEWENEDTTVTLFLNGEDYYIDGIDLMYESNELGYLANESLLQETDSGL